MEKWLDVVICGDNIDVMKMMPSGYIDLCYIDPPFMSQKHRSDYDDRWESMDEYLDFMKPRLREIHRVLKPSGSLYLHSDKHASHYLKVLLDQIFRESNFLNDITWKRTSTKVISKKNFPNMSDSILVYAKGKDYTFHPQKKPNDKRYPFTDNVGTYRLLPILRKFHPVNKTDGKKRYFPDVRKEIELPPDHVWLWNQERINKYIEDGYTFDYSMSGMPSSKKYHEDGDTVDNIWLDNFLHTSSSERIGYATQKPEKLLERVILASSNRGDVVLDAFCGSGTTLVAAKKLERRYVGIDINPKACEIARNRLNDSRIEEFIEKRHEDRIAVKRKGMF